MCASRPGKKVKRAQFTCHRAISVTVPWQSRVAYRTHQNGKEQKGTKSNDDGTKSNENEFTETLEHLLKLLQHFTETLKYLVSNIAMNLGNILVFNHDYMTVLYTEYLLPLSKFTK
jgi:hypothetical protein